MNEDKRNVTDSEAIFTELKERIIAGEWKPGEKIPSENQLCQATGASRITVRSAIQRLSSLGLVESKRGRGTFICELSGEQHLNSVIPYFALTQPDRTSMFEFRRIIETEGAALAALRADPDQIAAMMEATRKMAAATTTEEITKYDLEFHYLIMQGSRNSILVKVFEVLRETYFSLLHENVTLMGSTGAAYHQMIAIAIESHDADLARLLMQKHLSNTVRATINQRTDDPVDTDNPAVSSR